MRRDWRRAARTAVALSMGVAQTAFAQLPDLDFEAGLAGGTVFGNAGTSAGSSTITPGSGGRFGFVATDPNGGAGTFQTDVFSVTAGATLDFWAAFLSVEAAIAGDGFSTNDHVSIVLQDVGRGGFTQLFGRDVVNTCPADPGAPGRFSCETHITGEVIAFSGSNGADYVFGYSSGWERIFHHFAEGGDYRLTFSAQDSGDEIVTTALAFDAAAGSIAPAPVQPTVAPEPMSMALFGTGLAGLGALRRRRRREPSAE